MDTDAWLRELGAVYDVRLDDFVRTAAAITGGRESGRDAVHDAFVAAIRMRGQFRGEGSVEAWVWKAVVNEALKAHRRARQRAPHDAGYANRAETNGHSDDHAGVRASVALLPERQRLILFLRYYADLDYQQIADVLDLRRGTVSAALHAAHTTLRHRLEEVSDR